MNFDAGYFYNVLLLFQIWDNSLLSHQFQCISSDNCNLVNNIESFAAIVSDFPRPITMFFFFIECIQGKKE